MAAKWYANRSSLTANTDEEVAMAWVQLGPFASESEAFGEMVRYLWTKETEHYAADVLQEVSDDPEGNQWTVRSLRWTIRSV